VAHIIKNRRLELFHNHNISFSLKSRVKVPEISPFLARRQHARETSYRSNRTNFEPPRSKVRGQTKLRATSSEEAGVQRAE
jgi:hypothetical protein